ncbi:Holliday junction resolvase [Knoellia sinensis KCTC 19936]|uniref:Putative pre-16S rRNA nuclease n=1 Tax=Knoellia sinensis KCTC 19936 TaxID=1385520 RepID=A0A0A0JA61_9MICO|nr:Holliday junction resolvase RuvX [Knoellia sinensis]KGN32476.1 Holliday junction resolvase [Knoellia sinensis KCTC 19936]
MRPGVRLGVDVGTVRVGVAVSDPGGVLATPHATLTRSWPDASTGPDDVDEIVALCADRTAIEIIVGLPRSLSGDEGPSAAAARTYAAELARRVVPVGVRLVDERLTSVDAHRALRESGMTGRRQRAVVDQAAAVLILQNALDEERSSGRPAGEPVKHKRRRPKTKDGQR